MKEIQEEGSGAIVYLRQEGRGIGLEHKIQAYALQDIGYDTLDANLALGLPADAREYSIAAEMLKDVGIESVRLLTNNPLKVRGLEDNGVEVTRRKPHITGVSPYNERYLLTKSERMGHILVWIENVPSVKHWFINENMVMKTWSRRFSILISSLIDVRRLSKTHTESARKLHAKHRPHSFVHSDIWMR